MTRRQQAPAWGEGRWTVQFGGVGSRCPHYGQTLKELRSTATSHMAVLLLGPTGTGKELLARAVHAASGRRGAFVALNCGALPEALVCSELFGHERGAFSGAERAAPGALRSASGGTLFLDEVADAPGQVQVALLRALESQTVRPVGSTREHPVDVRIVAATSRRLRSDLQSGRFRSDLYFRLAGEEFLIPPLCERPSDLPFLCEELLQELGHTGALEADALAHLQEQAWPGNVRELKNRLQRAVLRGGKEQPLRRQDVVGGSGIFPLSPASGAGAPPLRDGSDASTRPWLRSLMRADLRHAAEEMRATHRVPPAPASTCPVSRRSARTWERALLLCLLCDSQREELGAELSRRTGRLFAAGWHLGERGHSLKRLAKVLGLDGEQQMLRLVEVVEGVVRG